MQFITIIHNNAVNNTSLGKTSNLILYSLQEVYFNFISSRKT